MNLDKINSPSKRENLIKDLSAPILECFSEEDALNIARYHGLEAEVQTALNSGMSPKDALQDWDILPSYPLYDGD